MRVNWNGNFARVVEKIFLQYSIPFHEELKQGGLKVFHTGFSIRCVTQEHWSENTTR